MISFCLTFLPSLLVAYVLVSLNFHPSITEDFLFVYLGIVSGVAVSVYGTYVQAKRADVPLLLDLTIMVDMSAILALLAALSYPRWTSVLIDSSLSFLFVGLVWLLGHSIAHAANTNWRTRGREGAAPGAERPEGSHTVTKSHPPR